MTKQFAALTLYIGVRYVVHERVGAVGKNRHGTKMEVIAYNNTDDIIVRFEGGYQVHTKWGNFQRGELRNVYDKTVCGIGFLGEGPYKTTDINGKDIAQYSRWKGMLLRCYTPDKYPAYKNCTVCEDWHNFQNFAKWYDENYYEIVGVKMELDKDILVKGNKQYSPSTCVFVPNNVNIHFTYRRANKDTPIGVCFDKSRGKYLASCKDLLGNSKSLGRWDTPEEAFVKYKEYKESILNQLAEKYKEVIPLKLYCALVNYEVEIND